MSVTDSRKDSSKGKDGDYGKKEYEKSGASDRRKQEKAYGEEGADSQIDAEKQIRFLHPFRHKVSSECQLSQKRNPRRNCGNEAYCKAPSSCRQDHRWKDRVHLNKGHCQRKKRGVPNKAQIMSSIAFQLSPQNINPPIRPGPIMKSISSANSTESEPSPFKDLNLPVRSNEKRIEIC